jgi:hypothetical protein
MNASAALSFGSLKNSWDVFLLFAVPVGGGIPAGVVLGQSKGIGWMAMSVLYFASDVLLAIVFEPFMILVGKLAKHSPFLTKFIANMKHITNKTIAAYGPNPGPFLLVVIAFGVDPMTGRAAALTQGHNFFSGWAVAIAGDMLFFWVVMASTIWLNNLLGDGTWAAVIIMILMFVIPALVRRVRRGGHGKLAE